MVMCNRSTKYLGKYFTNFIIHFGKIQRSGPWGTLIMLVFPTSTIFTFSVKINSKKERNLLLNSMMEKYNEVTFTFLSLTSMENSF